MKGIYAHYATSGHLLVVTGDGKLLAVPFDPKKMVLTGPPVAVLDGMLRSGPFEVNLAVSANGTLVYTVRRLNGHQQRLVGESRRLGAPIDTSWHVQGTISSVALSPDAKALAVTVIRGANQDIWVKQLPSGPFSRLTFGDTAHFRGAWTGDGRSVVYINDIGSGAGDPVERRADGTGAPQVLLHAKGMTFGQAVPTKDGRWLVLRRSTAEAGGGDLYAVKTGDTTLVPLVTSPARELSPAVSPDSRWLAYASDESGTSEVYVRPFPDVATARWQVSVSGGTNPVWSRNGTELFYINGRGEMASVAIRPGPTFNAGRAAGAVPGQRIHRWRQRRRLRHVARREAVPDGAAGGGARGDGAGGGAELVRGAQAAGEVGVGVSRPEHESP